MHGPLPYLIADLGPIAAAALLLGALGVGAVAAFSPRGRTGRRLAAPLLPRVPLALPLSLLLVLFCHFAVPLGVGAATGAILVFVLWTAREIVVQGRAMQRYVLRRLLGAPVVLLVLVTITFFLVRLAPGGPFDKEKRLDPEIQKLVEAKYDLHLPLHRQYGHYLWDLLWEGDLGPSFKQKGRSVNDVIGDHIGPTALLGLCALALTLLIGVSAGLLSGLKQNSFFDYASMTVAMVGLALPTFVVGPMLVLLFAMKLDWFAVSGWERFPRDLVLPAITLALPFAARVARLTRAGMLEVVNQDYIRTARAKGLPELTIVLRHTLKGTLLPVVAFLGPGIAVMLTGSLVVEMIFGVPGIGREFVESATNRDYPVALGLTILFGSLILVMNLLVDIAYAMLDPRIRHG